MNKVTLPSRTLKNSGLDWSLTIPSTWQIVRSKTIFRRMQRPVRPQDGVVTAFRDGVVTLRTNRRTTGFTEALQEIGYQGIRKGDLVIHAMDAFAGAIGVSDSDGKGTPVYSVCQPTGDANSWYYALVLREMSRSGYLLALAKGIRERSTDFRFSDFASLRVPLPPIEEQERIVRFVRHLDSKVNRLIKAKRRLIELLNEQKQAIIHQAVTRGLDPTIPLKPSGDGDVLIPITWERRSVMQLFSIGRGEVTSHEYIGSHPGPYPLYSSQTSNEGIMGWIDTYMFDGEYLTWTTDGAHAGTVFHRLGKFNCTNVCGTLKSKSTGIFLPFMRHALGIETKAHVRIDINPKLMNNMMARIRVNVPPLEEQIRLFKFLDAKLQSDEAVIKKTLAEIDLVREYRTRLVADVVTGQLDVCQHPWAKTEIEDPSETVLDELETEEHMENEQTEELDI